ncbi:MAG: aminoacetone oxidase family FAD-binding enzyme [Planctomycetaceae bacterium]|jgi:predicted Rossmann fold flavoprotein|nr:aminoacetone oxidase family FAD-binding enzyme [Planctomycetaceae bacterium]
MSKFNSGFRVIVVGGGVAGVCAGIFCGDDSCLLERNGGVGKKMLISGSGQCNLTHGGNIADFLQHYGNPKKANFVKPSLYSFDNIAVSDFFGSHGVPVIEREDGKIFPRSKKSSDLLNVLVNCVCGEILTGVVVEEVVRTDAVFLVRTNVNDFLTDNIILATGGNSYPTTGSKGDGFNFAKSLGHTIIQPRPALVPIIVQNFKFADSAGTTFLQVDIELRRNGKKIISKKGDVLFTHRGLSGPGILDVSRYVESLDEVRIIIFDSRSDAEIFSGKKSLKNALANSGIPSRFVIQLLNVLEISPDLPASETPREVRKKLAAVSFIVDKTSGWNESMVTAGGVAIDEVNRHTLESKLVKGLFFAGEILDVDGDCGGYNIQFAMSSGKLAGTSAAKK